MRATVTPRGNSLCEFAMRESFHRLAPALKQFHRLAGTHELSGRVEVLGPANVAAKILARLLGAPRAAGTGAIRFTLNASPREEKWTRHFPGSVMSSRLRVEERGGVEAGKVVERLGAARLAFALEEVDGALHMRLKQMHFLGVCCPRWLMPRVVAEETGSEGRVNFLVRGDVPFIGLVMGYQGFLWLPDEEAS